jgi:hypothetical protein
VTDLEDGASGMWYCDVAGGEFQPEYPEGQRMVAEILRLAARDYQHQIFVAELIGRLGLIREAMELSDSPIGNQILEIVGTLAERVRELEVCAGAIEILEEIEVGDPIFDDAKAFALAIVQKHRALEERVRELEAAERESEFTRILDARAARIAGLEEENRALKGSLASQAEENEILRGRYVALEAEMERKTSDFRDMVALAGIRERERDEARAEVERLRAALESAKDFSAGE